MQLAFGDALAIALLEGKGFSAKDFKIFHPGGQLGANLKFVRDIMHRGDQLPSVAKGTSMADAIITMSSKGFGCVLITQDDILIGIITDGDLRRHIGSDLLSYSVDDVMTNDPRVIDPNNLVSQALEVMNSSKITTLAVAENKKLVGLLHMHDLLRIGVV
jgi:arabinose-5-phosphate isomerase